MDVNPGVNPSPIESPNALLEALGYVDDAEKVGVRFETKSGMIYIVTQDDRRESLCWRLAPLLEVLAKLGDPPPGVSIGQFGDEATHWMLIDRTKNMWSLLPAALAKNIVTGSPMSPEDVEECRRLAEVWG